mgnify:CR=1 FL=1
MQNRYNSKGKPYHSHHGTETLKYLLTNMYPWPVYLFFLVLGLPFSFSLSSPTLFSFVLSFAPMSHKSGSSGESVLMMCFHEYIRDSNVVYVLNWSPTLSIKGAREWTKNSVVDKETRRQTLTTWPDLPRQRRLPFQKAYLVQRITW